MTQAVGIALALLLVIAVACAILYWTRVQRHNRVIRDFKDDLLAVSADASVGRRLTVPAGDSLGDLANTVNQLFDALGERDEEIQDRDRLFANFARTIPEVVLIHDERILLANDSAASLVGLGPEQLEGRQVADLVKPAYRALFRKTMGRQLAGQKVPRRLEIQLINGNDQGLWVEAQSSLIEYRGNEAVLTVARDVSYRKSLEVSLSRSKRQAQYTLESIAEGVITTDNEGRIDYMNRAAEGMTGKDRESAAGHQVSEIFS
ncbi:MAG: PAS domain S-box protein, partial [Woeseia sp.]